MPRHTIVVPEDAAAKTAHDLFYLEEYKQLRTEVLSLLTRLDTVLLYAAVGSTLVYSWIIVQGFAVIKSSPTAYAWLKLPKEVIYIGAWIPPALVACLGLFAFTTWRRIKQMGIYLGRLEERLGSATAVGLGWEHRKGSSWALPLTMVLWFVLVGSVAYATNDIRSIVAPGSCVDATKPN